MVPRGVPRIVAGMTDDGSSLVYPNGAYCEIRKSGEFIAAESKLSRLLATLDHGGVDSHSRTRIGAGILRAKAEVKSAHDRLLDSYGLVAIEGGGAKVVDHWHITRYGTMAWPA